MQYCTLGININITNIHVHSHRIHTHSILHGRDLLGPGGIEGLQIPYMVHIVLEQHAYRVYVQYIQNILYTMYVIEVYKYIRLGYVCGLI